MFSGKYPFQHLDEYKFQFAMMRRQRPSRPSDPLSATRGLNDNMWQLIEECWSEFASDRPNVDRIVETICHLPNRAVDTRPSDNLGITTSQIWHKQECHPFSSLT